MDALYGDKCAQPKPRENQLVTMQLPDGTVALLTRSDLCKIFVIGSLPLRTHRLHTHYRNFSITTQITADRDFEGKVAIVTGAASGIGRATVELLHARGASVIAEDVDPEVNALARPGIFPLVADVTKEEAARQSVATAVEQFGKLDILVNNAGIIINKLVVDMTIEDWDRIFAVNIRGVFLHSREAMHAMIPNKSGAIVNVGSYACFQTFPSIAAYASTKGAFGAVHPDACGRGNRTWHPRERRRLGRYRDQHLQKYFREQLGGT